MGAKTFAVRRFTVEEYHRMAETGILSPDERVELIRGTVRKMSPKNRAHVIASARVFTVLLKELEGRASVYSEAPVVLAELESEPEPDVLVCSNPEIDAYGTNASTPLLVVEVADSSLKSDLGDKVSLHAEAEIPEYWVVNLVERVLVVFREPRNGSYQRQLLLELGARVTPAPWPDVDIAVVSLFPEEASDR